MKFLAGRSVWAMIKVLTGEVLLRADNNSPLPLESFFKFTFAIKGEMARGDLLLQEARLTITCFDVDYQVDPRRGVTKRARIGVRSLALFAASDVLDTLNLENEYYVGSWFKATWVPERDILPRKIKWEIDIDSFIGEKIVEECLYSLPGPGGLLTIPIVGVGQFVKFRGGLTMCLGTMFKSQHDDFLGLINQELSRPHPRGLSLGGLC